MTSFKLPFISLVAIFLLYLSFSFGPTLNYYTGTDRANYVIINNKKYYVSDMKDSPGYKKFRKDYVTNLNNVFQGFAMEEVLRLEAKEKNTTVDKLLSDNKKSPSNSEVEGIYEQYKDRLQGMSLEDARQRIVEYINTMNEQSFKSALIEKYSVSYNFEKPERLTVEAKQNPYLGSNDAKITIIEFSDFECPFCQRSQSVNKELREKYKGQIKWVFRDFPLSFHPNAMFAHIAANCANQQGKYWELFELLFRNTGGLERQSVIKFAESVNLDMKKFNECSEDPKIREEIMNDIAEGQELGVNGTPAFFINGIMVEGAQPISSFVNIIEQDLK